MDNNDSNHIELLANFKKDHDLIVEMRVDIINIKQNMEAIKKCIEQHNKFLQDHITKSTDDCGSCKERLYNEMKGKTNSHSFVIFITVMVTIQLFVLGLLVNKYLV